MRFFALFLLVTLFCSAVNTAGDDTLECSRFVIDAVILQLFEFLRQLIKLGSIINNITVLDPLVVKRQEIDLEYTKFRINAEILNFTLAGLGNFELLGAKFNKDDVSLDLTLRFPSLTILSEHYEMSGNIFEILPLSGNGLLNIEAHDLKFWSKVYLKQSEDGRSILIDKFLDTHFEIDKIVSRTQYDGNIDDILNAMIGDLLPKYLSRFSRLIAAQYMERITEFLNQYFNHFESWRFIAAIL
ncbi:unnamed protein product [Parnassius mnemosyne]|uniref:Uncharacterized protein n=1 Tax=Parnassius mnemosyne TaxID=213953 RepID=A0AAV1LYE2_9NEOP